MIRLISFVATLSLLTSFIALNGTQIMTSIASGLEDRETLWEQVENDLKKNLPRSAIQNLDKIYRSAIDDQAWAEATRAICQNFVVEGSINAPGIPFAIKKLQAFLPNAPAETQPMLNVILANWFHLYFQQNRWQIQERSQTTEQPGEDFLTWDLKQILNQIDSYFSQALASAESLKKIPIDQYSALLKAGDMSDAYRPTLYDFVVYDAIRFYGLDEQITRRQGAFRIRSDSPIYAPADEFLAWTPTTDDENSVLLRAVKLYQDLLNFHKNDAEPSAFLDADLSRLRFGKATAEGTESTARYQAALQRFSDKHVSHPLSSLALAYLAQSLQSQNQLVTAKEIAEIGKARFPQSNGGRLCKNLITAVLSSRLSISTEKVWAPENQQITVNYRNVSDLYFRLIKFDFAKWSNWGNEYSVENVFRADPSALMAIKPAAEWSRKLEPTTDYQEREVTLPATVDVKSGCYLLVASNNPEFEFSKKDFTNISAAGIWVSNLAVVTRGNGQEGQIFDALSGKPLSGVEVRTRTWVRDNQKGKQSEQATVKTDGNGFYKLSDEKENQGGRTKFDFRYEDNEFGFISNVYPVGRNPSRRFYGTIFFADRSIYRPGQTIQFKGICIQSDPRADHKEGLPYHTLPGESIKVSLRDANGQIVETRDFRTNEFGSFSGSFTAPRDRLTGRMSLQAQGINGTTSIRVEEYKRPKFYVEIDQPKDATQLGQTVKFQGRAVAYTGAPSDNSKVVWRVTRQVRYPGWYGRRYWYRPINSPIEEIANGVTNADTKGNFTIEFKALADESVPRKNDPFFNFVVYADVTDSAGETRATQQTARIGYSMLQADIKIAGWQTSEKPVDLKVSVSNLNGEGQATQGDLTIFSLVPPEKIQRAKLGQRPRYGFVENQEEDLSKINAWPIGATSYSERITTDESGEIATQAALPAGAYKAVFETRDSAGQKVRSEFPFLIHNPKSDAFPVPLAYYFQSKNNTVEPGNDFVGVWGTGYKTGRAYVEFAHRGEIIKAFWTETGGTQQTLRFPIKEEHRGGLQLRITYVRENRLYTTNQPIDVPWTNKKLAIRWERFVSKLRPGQQETWTAVVKGPDVQKATAELVATMYDASLDAYAAHPWRSGFNVFYRDRPQRAVNFRNQQQYLSVLFGSQPQNYEQVSITYRTFVSGIGIFNVVDPIGRAAGVETVELSADTMSTPRDALAMEGAVEKRLMGGRGAGFGSRSLSEQSTRGNAPEIKLDTISTRKNLQETAFFYPHLELEEDGSVRIQFEAPEALTQWKFLGFAHDNELRSALLTGEATTSKDLMVQTNPPRFLRVGDTIEFSVKVTNQSDQTQTGQVRLQFQDARTGKSMDAELNNQSINRDFEIPAKQSTSLAWKIQVPNYVGTLIYRAVGGTGTISDGEEGFLPVLSNRILVTESLPLPIRGKQTKDFNFDRLIKSAESDSLQSQNLTVQVTSNPAWYAVMALPYLMEYPHQCSEQVFNRLYANLVGQQIVTSDPKVGRIFEQWRGTEALDSPLQKNEDVRNILLEETPWLLTAQEESQSRRDVGNLLNANRMNAESRRALDQLMQMQLQDGAWPWFPGGQANDFITLYVTTGFGRLRNMGADLELRPVLRALDRLDGWINKIYQAIKKRQGLEKNNLSPSICLYLYGRSFFLKEKAVADQNREAFTYFVNQGKQYWPKLGNRQSQGHLALALHRMGDRETPMVIVKSLTERSQQDDEMGMFWREASDSWWWYQAPIETQALMIEVYQEVAKDAAKVEELKIWLLKQKQTQNWKTTKATADACYALLMQGTSQLASDELISLSLGNLEVGPEDVEAGTGFYERVFVANEIQPDMGKIKMTKTDEGIGWGSIHWQYLESIDKIQPYEGTPLTLKKRLFIKENTTDGPVLSEVTGPVNVGDELVTRVELRVDRDMEFIHLKDYRGSGTEPVNVISRYQFQDGLGYYQATRDTASHFFIDYLPRGTYVFEYSVRVQNRGRFETGIAEIQSMYAPEFNSHSGSVEITVK